VEAACEKQAVDIAMLDIQQVCSFADYFVICSGETARQIEAIRDEIDHVMRKEGISPHHYEGTVDSGWVLLDFGQVIIHIFAPFEREYYRFDELWSGARAVVRIQ